MTSNELKTWKGVDLDEMRQLGDPLFDEPIANRMEQDPEFWGQLHELLVHRRDLSVHAPIEMESLPPIDPEEVLAGQRVFEEHGPEILMTLCCYSLPAAFAAANGAQVLSATGYITMQTNRRLWETTQMVVDVMTEGGLDGPDAKGMKTAGMVRQLHAAVRQLLLSHPSKKWDAKQLGTPINQEDMAGTLMTFSWLIIEGLRKIHIHLTPEEEQSYLNAWRAIGREMGVVDELIPATVDEAEQLTNIIMRRQVHKSEEGALMTGAVLDWMRGQAPMFFKGFPAVLMRHFLPKQVANDLDVPRWTPEHILVDIFLGLLAFVDHKVTDTSSHRTMVRNFSIHVLNAWLAAKVKGPTEYQLGDELMRKWEVAE